MRLHLLALLTLLVLAPLTALGWLGVRYTQEAHDEVTTRFDAVVVAKLAETGDVVAGVLAARARGLLALTEDFPTTPDEIRRLARRDRRFTHALLFAADGALVSPPPHGPNSEAERSFLERTRGLWDGGATFGVRRSDGTPATTTTDHGWHIWYWGGGLNLMFWRRLAEDRLVAIEVGRIELLAELVAALPTSDAVRDGARTALLDASGRVVYQWGDYEPAGSGPHLERSLDAPLGGWRLAWYGRNPQPPAVFAVWMTICGVGLLLLVLAIQFYRANDRALRVASQRVTFVNQVSHELKTPLTNIRMYAELLEDALYEPDEKELRYLGVIVEESQRLSRMITNVLTLARTQRSATKLRRKAGTVDAVVAEVLERFGPCLSAAGIQIVWSPNAPDHVLIDADIFAQIVGNLLSNVEKYAATGGEVRLRSAHEKEESVLLISDAGPGIPRAQRRKVFDAFHRVDGTLTESASGTGIGLGIARDLARLHGGDLTLEQNETGATGATFKLRIHTPKEQT